MTVDDLKGCKFLGECMFFSPGADPPYGWIRIIISIGSDDRSNELRSLIGSIRRGRTDLYFHPGEIRNKKNVPGPRSKNSEQMVNYIRFPGTYFVFSVDVIGDSLQAVCLLHVKTQKAQKMVALAATGQKVSFE